MISKIRSYLLGSQEVKNNFLLLVAVVMIGPILLGLFKENKKKENSVGIINNNYISRGIYNLKVYSTSEYLRRISMMFNNTDFTKMFMSQYLRGMSVEEFGLQEVINNLLIKEITKKIKFDAISENQINKKIKDTDFFRKHLMINLPQEIFTAEEKIDQKKINQLFNHLGVKKEEFESFIQDSVNRYYLEMLIKTIKFPTNKQVDLGNKSNIKISYIEYAKEDKELLSKEEISEKILESFYKKKIEEGFFFKPEVRTVSGWKIKKNSEESKAESKSVELSKISAEIRIHQQDGIDLEAIKNTIKKHQGITVSEKLELGSNHFEQDIMNKIFSFEKNEKFYTIDSKDYIYVLKIEDIKFKEKIDFEACKNDVQKMYNKNLIRSKIITLAEEERVNFEKDFKFKKKEVFLLRGKEAVEKIKALNISTLRDGMTFIEEKEGKIAVYGIESISFIEEESIKNFIKSGSIEKDFFYNFIASFKESVNIKLY